MSHTEVLPTDDDDGGGDGDDNRTIEDGLSKSILPIEIIFESSNAWESLNSFGSFKSIFSFENSKKIP